VEVSVLLELVGNRQRMRTVFEVCAGQAEVMEMMIRGDLDFAALVGMGGG